MEIPGRVPVRDLTPGKVVRGLTPGSPLAAVIAGPPHEKRAFDHGCAYTTGYLVPVQGRGDILVDADRVVDVIDQVTVQQLPRAQESGARCRNMGRSGA